MVQLFFLSILFTGVAGFVLLLEEKTESRTNASTTASGAESAASEHNVGGNLGWRIRGLIRGSSFSLVLGILALLTGIVKLLYTYNGGIPILGDFLPAAAGISSGCILLFDFYRVHSDIGSADNTPLAGFVDRYRKIFGAGAIFAAVMHFLFPAALLL
jgi:hypothetical protein